MLRCQRWIQGGGPIQALQYKRPRKPAVIGPLRTAIRKKNRDLVLLLLCNGYRLDLEPSEPESVLDEALKMRALDILDLLVDGVSSHVWSKPTALLTPISQISSIFERLDSSSAPIRRSARISRIR